MRKFLVVISATILALLFAVPAEGKPRAARFSEAKYEQLILNTHNTYCDPFTQYKNCVGVAVTVDNFGPGNVAESGPANNTVKYNSYYGRTYVDQVGFWAGNVAHEMGGHHDAWAELVTKVGVNQAWTDYYDLDYFGEVYFEGKFGRDFTRFEGKELYLDCRGPVKQGYTGWYFQNRQLSTSACQGHEVIMQRAITEVRPS